MIKKLFFYTLSSILGLYFSDYFLEKVIILSPIKTLILAGFILGIINFLIKPIILKITFPLKILTFGLFPLLLNMFLVWFFADVLFLEKIEIKGIIPLFFTSIIVSIVNSVFELLFLKRK